MHQFHFYPTMWNTEAWVRGYAFTSSSNYVLLQEMVPTLDGDKGLEEYIREAAKIYRKQTSRPLTPYQKQINECAQDICIKNPTMLRSRARLLEAAREVVDSTYAFKRVRADPLGTSPVIHPNQNAVNCQENFEKNE